MPEITEQPPRRNGGNGTAAFGRALVDQRPSVADQQQAFADGLQRAIVELAGQHQRKPWQVRATLEYLISGGSWPYR